MKGVWRGRVAALSLSLLLCSNGPLLVRGEEEEFSAAGFNRVRVEQEGKLLVPLDKADEVWAFLQERYVLNTDSLKELDALFTSYVSDEQFTDTYFDTPTLQLYTMQSGVRHRRRVNLTDPNGAKSGRELMQIKLNDISGNALERGEIKFPIEYPQRVRNAEDAHPMLGIVKPSEREGLKQRLTALGLDPYSMKPILTVHDSRRRIYILRDEKPFMSISLDRAHSRIWWGKADFVEIEPELNEIVFTDAGDATKRYMESILQRIVSEIVGKFPYIHQDPTPKYNKSLDRIRAQIPLLKLLVKTNMHSDQGVLAVLGIFILALCGGLFLAWRKISDRLFPQEPRASQVAPGV